MCQMLEIEVGQTERDAQLIRKRSLFLQAYENAAYLLKIIHDSNTEAFNGQGETHSGTEGVEKVDRSGLFSPGLKHQDTP